MWTGSRTQDRFQDVPNCENSNESSGFVNDRVFCWINSGTVSFTGRILAHEVSILTFENSHNLFRAAALPICEGEWLIRGRYEKSSSTRMRSRRICTKCMTSRTPDIWSTSLPCYVVEVLLDGQGYVAGQYAKLELCVTRDWFLTVGWRRTSLAKCLLCSRAFRENQ